MKKIILALILSLSTLFFNSVMAEPTVKEIYQMGQTDKEQALKMINEIIAKHPNSSKAYFVKTELLLMMSKKDLAKESFIRAEKLDSTFSYSKPEVVTRVRNALGIKTKTETISNENMLIVGGIIIGGILIIWLIIRRREPKTPVYMPTNYSNKPITPYNPVTNPVASNTVATQPQSAQSGSSSVGSGIMGNIATGVAVGAGAVAGAALANHLINGSNRSDNNHTSTSNSSYTPDSDYSVSDSGGWDSSSSDSSSDDSNW